MIDAKRSCEMKNSSGPFGNYLKHKDNNIDENDKKCYIVPKKAEECIWHLKRSVKF